MTVRNWAHSRILIRVGRYLDAWNDEQSQPRGQVVGGEAGFRLARNPDTTVGVDVAYISAEVVATRNPRTSLIQGVPTLAVEILSPSDTQQDIAEKVQKYLGSGVKAVWLINPDFETILVLEPDKSPVSFNKDQVLSGDPYLAGFSVAVAKLFG